MRVLFRHSCLFLLKFTARYQHRLIKEGAEPQIAHLQHSLLSQQSLIDALLHQQKQMQERLQVLELQIADKK
jgi:hypothetical protein